MSPPAQKRSLFHVERKLRFTYIRNGINFRFLFSLEDYLKIDITIHSGLLQMVFRWIKVSFEIKVTFFRSSKIKFIPRVPLSCYCFEVVSTLTNYGNDVTIKIQRPQLPQ